MIHKLSVTQARVPSLHTIIHVVVARVAEAEPGIWTQQLLTARYQRHVVDSCACAGGGARRVLSGSALSLGPEGLDGIQVVRRASLPACLSACLSVCLSV